MQVIQSYLVWVIILFAGLGFYLGHQIVLADDVLRKDLNQPLTEADFIDIDSLNLLLINQKTNNVSASTFTIPYRDQQGKEEIKAYLYKYQPTQRSLYLHHHPRILFWAFTVIAFFTIAFGFFPVVLGKLLQMGMQFHLNSFWHWLIAGGILFFLILCFGGTVNMKLDKMLAASEIMAVMGLYFEDPGAQMAKINNWGHLSALLCIAGILIINAGVSRLSSQQSAKTASTSTVHQKMLTEQLMELHKNLKLFLIIAGTLVTAAIVATAVLRSALLAKVPDETIFPIEFLYIYGVTYSLLLAMTYLPTFFNLREHSNIITKMLPDEKREIIEAKMLAQVQPLENLKIAFAILAPLLTSIGEGFFR